MKKAAPALLTLILFASQLSGQSLATLGAKLGLAVGGDIEMPYGLEHTYLLKTAKNTGLDLSEFPAQGGELTKMNCDNGTARFTFSINPKGSPGTEWQFALLSIDGRIDMVQYELPEPDQYLEVSATNKELALETAFLKTSQANKTFAFWGGIGTNIGISHHGEVRMKGFLRDHQLADNPEVPQEIDRIFPQKKSLNQRLFLQAGMGIRFLKAMQFGLELRKGFGYRASFDGPFTMTFLKRSIALSVRYVY